MCGCTGVVHDLLWRATGTIATTMSSENLTVRERFRICVRDFLALDLAGGRADSAEFQQKVTQLLTEFRLVQSIVDGLSLFSDNEQLREINTPYLSFATLPYYAACLYMRSLADASGAYDEKDKFQNKPENLQRAKVMLAAYLNQLESFGGVLLELQKKTLDSFEKSYDPSVEELLGQNKNPVQKRAEKIENFKAEKALKGKLQILEGYYEKNSTDDDEDALLSLDEEVVRAIYIDQLRLFAINAFDNLESIAMELQVLKQRPAFESRQKTQDTRERLSALDSTGYTSRLERNPAAPTHISELLSRQGKILRPFTITRNKQELREKVFGTGQTLPSMTVEEYLDYELANGKMAKEEEKKDDESESDDSDEELRKREWDDWKDENPRGSGNMKANLG